MARCPYDAKHANVALFAGKKRVCMLYCQTSIPVLLSNISETLLSFCEVKIHQMYKILLWDTTTHWVLWEKNININFLQSALIKHWNMFELDGKVDYVWVRGLVAVAFNIVLNTLWFILMAVLRQHVKSESQSVLYALEQIIDGTTFAQCQEFAAY